MQRTTNTDVVYSGMKCSCTYQRNYFRCYTLTPQNWRAAFNQTMRLWWGKGVLFVHERGMKTVFIAHDHG